MYFSYKMIQTLNFCFFLCFFWKVFVVVGVVVVGVVSVVYHGFVGI